ncbi:hypothetical protein C1X05_14630 [Laceyella sacchari]|nr:hypothetical protein C1X05_14630 [Laceyella sacchari]
MDMLIEENRPDQVDCIYYSSWNELSHKYSKPDKMLSTINTMMMTTMSKAFAMLDTLYHLSI